MSYDAFIAILLITRLTSYDLWTENNFPIETRGIPHCLLAFLILMRSPMPICFSFSVGAFIYFLWKLAGSSFPWCFEHFNTTYLSIHRLPEFIFLVTRWVIKMRRITYILHFGKILFFYWPDVLKPDNLILSDRMVRKGRRQFGL